MKCPRCETLCAENDLMTVSTGKVCPACVSEIRARAMKAPVKYTSG